ICSVSELDTLLITNTGNYPLTLSNPTVQNAVGRTFIVVSYPSSILPAQQGLVIVQATATGTGQVTGTLVITNNDTDPGKSPFQVQLKSYKRLIAAGFNQDTLLTLPSTLINTLTSGCINYVNKGDGLQVIEGIDAFIGGDGSISLASPLPGASVAAA